MALFRTITARLEVRQENPPEIPLPSKKERRGHPERMFLARRGQLIVLEAVSMGFGAVPERVLLPNHLVVRTQRPQKHRFRHQRLSCQARIREISISGSLSLSVDRLDLGTRSISRISSGRHLKLLSSI